MGLMRRSSTAAPSVPEAQDTIEEQSMSEFGDMVVSVARRDGRPALEVTTTEGCQRFGLAECLYLRGELERFLKMAKK